MKLKSFVEDLFEAYFPYVSLPERHAVRYIHSFCSLSLSYERSLASSRGDLSEMESIAFSFNFQYFIISLRSSITCLRCIPHFAVHSILLSLTLRNTSSFLTQSVQLIVSILLQHHISKSST